MRTPSTSTATCAGLLRAMGDETRLRILEALLVRDRCVTELVQAIGRGQPHVSHHLRILRDCGLVEGLRQGKRVCYRIAPAVKRALRGRHRQTLEFGCCRISFSDSAPAGPSR